MALGRKTGGRQTGTPNKRTAHLAERLEALGCDPVGELVNLAQAADIDPTIRVRCYIDLLAYLYPKRKAVEVSGAENPIVITFSDKDRGCL
jgi:hypothetical protein